MRWLKTIKYQTMIVIDEKMFNVICEGDPDESYALSANGEYICDVETLPSEEELREFIDNYITLNEMADMSFPRR